MKNPSDARAQRSRRKILDATQRVLVEHGVDSVTILAVAERAGVQRSTVYNHWTDRLELVTDAIENYADASRPDSPDTEGARAASPLDQVRSTVLGLGRSLAGDWGAIAASLAAAAEHDEALASAHHRFVQSRRCDVAALLTRAIAAGEIDPDVDPLWVTGLLVGPLYYERLVAHQAMPDGEIVRHIDRVVELIR